MRPKTFYLALFSLSILSAQQKQPFNLEELYSTTAFDEHHIENIEWMPGSNAFTYTEKCKET